MIPFTKPSIPDDVLDLLTDVLQSRVWTNGSYTKQCESQLRDLGYPHAQLTPSCTSALEMAFAFLKPGDEVILPSWTYASTANAIALRGAVPVFIDCTLDTLNLDITQIPNAISDKTVSICPVHYAGVVADIDQIRSLIPSHIWIIEDSAQAFLSRDSHNHLAGTVGDAAAFSFHQTKNVAVGEGGFYTSSHADLATAARIWANKGCDRRAYDAGTVSQYGWTELGTSASIGEFQAALLLGQFGPAERLMMHRRMLWHAYFTAFSAYPEHFCLPNPSETQHNAHIFWFLVNDKDFRDTLLDRLITVGIQAQAHYLPLHSSPAGLRYGRSFSCPNTERAAETIVRLPLFNDMSVVEIEEVVSQVLKCMVR